MAMITGTASDDVLTGTPADDSITGLAGDDRLIGGGGHDTLSGGSGDDTLGDAMPGKADAYSMAGGTGDDIYFVDNAGDAVTELSGQGIDKVFTSISYGLTANVENLGMLSADGLADGNINGTGNELDNVITGNEAGNVLTGLAGNDTIDGSIGFDAAVFRGTVASYRFADNGTQVTVMGPDGTDTLADIEQLSFTNLSFSIADRGHFDSLYYLNHNPDVAAAGLDPLTHYLTAGSIEGRDPNQNVHLASIDGLEYIASYNDLMAAFGSNAAAGKQHFGTQGLFEDRAISFDGLEYIASYGDLVNTFHNQVVANPDPDIGATHYILAGHAEGRVPDHFDAAQYLANYSDLQAAFHGDLHATVLHYITAGYFEGRTDHA